MTAAAAAVGYDRLGRIDDLLEVVVVVAVEIEGWMVPV